LTMAARTSDHIPILVSFSPRQMDMQGQGLARRTFKFEAIWMSDEECGEVISAAWSNDNIGEIPSEGIQRRLGACQRALLSWSGQKFGKVEDDIKRKSEQLAALQRNESPALNAQIRSLKKEIEDLLDFQELKWK